MTEDDERDPAARAVIDALINIIVARNLGHDVDAAIDAAARVLLQIDAQARIMSRTANEDEYA